MCFVPTFGGTNRAVSARFGLHELCYTTQGQLCAVARRRLAAVAADVHRFSPYLHLGLGDFLSSLSRRPQHPALSNVTRQNT